MPFNDEQKKILVVIVLMGMVALGAIASYWFMLGKGQVSGYEGQEKKTRAEIAVLDKKMADIETFRNETKGNFEQLQASITQIEKRLPQNREAVGFFEALDAILRSTGVINQRLAVGEINEQSRYAEIPYSIRASGRYHEFGQFLNLVENNPDRFMRVKSFTVKNEPAKPSVHPIEVDIATFMFVER